MTERGRARILLAGNPNAGKTTIFNALTGSDARVGNYPGITIDRRSGKWSLGPSDVELVDLPGSYSLTARSPEEEVAIQSILERGDAAPDAVIVVVDSTSMRRGLYFALQVLEVGLPTVLALSLADEARSLGLALDVEALSQAVGVPVVAIAAAKKEGLDELGKALGAVLERKSIPKDPVYDVGAPVAATLAAIADGFVASRGLEERPARALARYALLSADRDRESSVLDADSMERVLALRTELVAAGHEPDLAVVGARFSFVDDLARATIGDARPIRTKTEIADRVLTHPIFGLVAFALVMALVFEALFAGADPFMGLIESGIGFLQSLVVDVMPAGPLRELFVGGILAGVGNVVVFVPQIAFLFLFVTLLEDSGYLARVAFVIDRLMAGVGLHGKAFVPLLSGFACAIPAVLSTRTIEDRRDRLVTMLALPLMSCSARLPVYALVIATVFPHQRRVFGFLSLGAVALFALYAFSVAMTLLAAAILRRTVLRGPRPALVLELPPYRAPIARNVIGAVIDRVRSFLTEAGTTILALSIVLWALLHFPKDANVEAHHASQVRQIESSMPVGTDRDEALAVLSAHTDAVRMERSALGRFGRAIEPVFEPLGFDWRIDIGILGAFAAREVFVSTLGVVFGVGETDDEARPLRSALSVATRTDGSRLLDIPTGASLLVFFVLACQCMSTVAVVKREAGGWRWALLLVTYMSVLAYVGAFLTHAAARGLGLG